ncbi:MAG: protein-export chaperone SecB [Rhodospirillaceae bacterium]|nr:protein-export chaperone SecB [Rhodospirillaceae bacterium]
MNNIPTDDSKSNEIKNETSEKFIEPKILVESQYIKDLSYENPAGPNVAAIDKQPEVNIEVTTSARSLEERKYEVTLVIRGEAKSSEETIFIIELTYAGVLMISNAPEDAIGPILLIEGARLLFPFARNIVADVSRDGGFPPLFINPIDFVQLYREQHLPEEPADSAGEC